MPTLMPSVKLWASSISRTRSKESSVASPRRRSSLLPEQIYGKSSLDLTRRVSEISLSKMDANDSERTLVGTLEVEDLDSRMSPHGQRRHSNSSPDYRSQKDGAIELRVDFFVVEDDRYAVRLGNYTGVWAGTASGSIPQTRSRYFGDHIHQHAYCRV